MLRKLKPLPVLAALLCLGCLLYLFLIWSSHPTPEEAALAASVSRCRGDDRVINNGVTPDLLIASCTAMIESGKYATPYWAFYRRGVGYLDAGQNDRAIQDFDQAIKFYNPKLVFDSALYSRGVAYANKGYYDRAILDFDAAISINPKNADSLYGRGVTKLKTRDIEGGNADIAAAKEIDAEVAERLAKFGIKP